MQHVGPVIPEGKEFCTGCGRGLPLVVSRRGVTQCPTCRLAALTPEVLETAIFGMRYAEIAAKGNLDFGPADSFARARAVLESLK